MALLLSKVNQLCAAEKVRDVRKAKEHETVMKELSVIKAAVVKCMDLEINWPIVDAKQLTQIERKMAMNPLYGEKLVIKFLCP